MQNDATLGMIAAEVEHSFDQAADALQRYTDGAATAEVLDEARRAIQLLRGVLQVADVAGAPRVLLEIEQLLGESAPEGAPPESEGGMIDARVESLRGLEAVRQYVAGLVAGVPAQPMALAATLQEILAARGSDRPAGLELFDADLSRPLPAEAVAHKSADGIENADSLHDLRSRFEKCLLEWLRGEATDLSAIRAVVESVHAQVTEPAPWWIAGAFIDHIGSGALPISLHVKRVFAGLDKYLSRLLAGSTDKPEQLMQELLYFVAQGDANGAQVEQVRQHYQIASAQPHGIAPVPGQAHDESVVPLQALQELWEKAAGGDAASARSFATRVGQVSRQLPESFSPLLETLRCAAEAHADASDPGDRLALEVASALLVLEEAMSMDSDSPAAAERVDAMNRRVQKALHDQDAAAPDWPDLTGETATGVARERSLLSVLGGELVAVFGTVEERLATYFEDRHNADAIVEAEQSLAQVRGTLQVVGESEAAAAVAYCIEETSRLRASAMTGEQQAKTDLASVISALTFYVARLGQAEADLAEILRKAGAPAGATSPTVMESVEPESSAGQNTVVDLDPTGNLDANSIDEATCTGVQPQESAASAGAALQGGEWDEASDPEMLPVFIEEADFVLSRLAAMIERLRLDSRDAEALSTLQRGFHTLKGSGRMVDLRHFADTCTALEQVLDEQIRCDAAADDELLRLLEAALSNMRVWVDALRNDGRARIDAADLTEWSDRVNRGIVDAQAAAEYTQLQLEEAPTVVIGDADSDATADQPAQSLDELAPIVISDDGYAAADGSSELPDELASTVISDADDEVDDGRADLPALEISADDATADGRLELLDVDLPATEISTNDAAADGRLGLLDELASIVNARADEPADDGRAELLDVDLPATEISTNDATADGRPGLLDELASIVNARADEPADDGRAELLDVDLPATEISANDATADGPPGLLDDLPSTVISDADEAADDGRAELLDADLPAMEFGDDDAADDERAELLDVDLPAMEFGDDDAADDERAELLDVDLPAMEFGDDDAADDGRAELLDVDLPAMEFGDDDATADARADLLNEVAPGDLFGDDSAPAESADWLVPEEAPGAASGGEGAAGDGSAQLLHEDSSTLVIGDVKVSRTLFEVFLGEARRTTKALAAELSDIDAVADEVRAHERFRLAHTLCGISATTGFTTIRELAGALEEVLRGAHERGLQFGTGDRDLFEAVAVALLDMFHAIESLQAPTKRADLETQLRAIAQQQENWATSTAAKIADDIGHAVDAQDPSASPQLSSLLAESPSGTGVPDVMRPAPTERRRQQRMQDDLDLALLPAFLEEAADLIPQIGEGLRSWRAEPQWPDRHQSLTRLLHTFKGAARMAGAMALGELTHSMETRIAAATGLQVIPDSLFEGLEVSFDRMGILLERIAHPPQPSVGDDPAGIGTTEILASAGTGELAASAADVAIVPSGEASPARQLLRVRFELLERLATEAGELAVSRSSVEGEVHSIRTTVRDMGSSIARLRQQVRELEIQTETQIQSRHVKADEPDTALDPLELDRFTRLQELTRQIDENANDVTSLQQAINRHVDGCDGALAAQARMTRMLQDSLVSVRLVPFATLNERLYRVVRLTARDSGRRASLDIRGSRANLDRGVVDRIAAPLEHLLRNAVVHGIEPLEERRAAGKPDAGEIVLDVSQEGNELVLVLHDDGRGLDLERLRARAVEAGRIRADDALSQEQITQLAFEPGVSTALEVNASAGRGVGLDVVRNDVAAVGGRIEVEFEPSRGTVFTVRLPLTMTVMQVLVTRCGGQLFALPAMMVDQVRTLKPRALESVCQSGEVNWQANHYPYYDLRDLLALGNASGEPQAFTPLVLVRGGAQRAAIRIDELVAHEEVVIKQIGSQLAGVTGMVGAAVRGSGEIALILNPIRLAQNAPLAPVRKPATKSVDKAAASIATVLIVDDSPTVRKITSRVLARKGYRVLEARDGLEAIESLVVDRPELVLLDAEMPRMDGFEVLRRMRSEPRWQHLPVMMITSRTADKHRNHAFELGANAFLSKPFEEQELVMQVAELIEGERV